MMLILGGTHEGAALCQWLEEQKLPFKLSVATALGQKLYAQFGTACEMHRFTEASLETYIKAHGIKLLIDTTHPHAYEVKKVAEMAAMRSEIRTFRLERAMMKEEALVKWQQVLENRLETVETMEDAVSALVKTHRENHRYMVTGTKYIKLFYEHFPKTCCYFRVMPSLYSMEECATYNVPLDHIIGIKAPCSPELNQAFFKAYDITHFIFKESGEGSATLLNLTSLVATQVKGMLVKMPEKEQKYSHLFYTVESLKQAILMEEQS